MAKIESLVPVNGVGFRTNNRTDNSHFATQVVHDLLIKIAGLWHDNHLHLWFEDEQTSTPRLLRNFTKGDDVKRFQEKLIAAGFPIEGGADGKFGQHTENAVRAFQTAHPPLPANGIADEATQSALGL